MGGKWKSQPFTHIILLDLLVHLGMEVPSTINDWYSYDWASQEALVVKKTPANAEDVRDVGSTPGSGRSPGGGRGNRLQYSCLENPMDRGAWRATVHGVTKSWKLLKRLSMQAQSCDGNQGCLTPKSPLLWHLLSCSWEWRPKGVRVSAASASSAPWKVSGYFISCSGQLLSPRRLSSIPVVPTF